MNRRIEIHIDELVLHGFTRAEGEYIKTALENELSRLFNEQGIPSGINAAAQYDFINAGSIDMTSNSKAGIIGTNIAGAVYRSIQSSVISNK